MSNWLKVRWPLDRVLAAVLLVLLLPIVFGLAVLVRASSPGPALIRLPRIGQGGRAFRMWKLRSMHHGTDRLRADGGPLTTADDARITPLGRFLRRWRLDELPQLVNVIGGDMALVGPRPETPEYVDLDDPLWVAVLAARPGIAGPTQVLIHRWEERILTTATNDRYATSILPVKLAIDAWYVRKASPALDALTCLSLVQDFVVRSEPIRLQRWMMREVRQLTPLVAP